MAPLETYASSAWVNTSIPASAVTEAGAETVSSGSRMATGGRSAWLSSGYLIPFARSVITA